MKYLPDKYPKGRQPDRDYLFNVLNTLRPNYVKMIIANAFEQRNGNADDDIRGESIHVSEEWQK